ncbi:MAG TPA: hypothetical protein PKM63_21875 [Panacibacter sp.]|nr:hypothetical protein [Panacibacter sp.]HNP46962.1 hypothetical protein [Panacibacter sp.]
MKTRKFLTAVATNILFAVLLAALTGINVLACGIAVLAVGGLMAEARAYFNGGLSVGLAQEVWIPLVKDAFYPDNSFLNAASDMSSLVNNDVINFAEAGADPAVLKNNTTYPISATVASDTPLSVTLDYYDTESTIVRNAIAVELVYDQRLLYANKHKKALFKKIGMDAAYAYAPTVNDSTKNNTVLALGDTDSLIDAVIDMQKAYNSFDDDGSNRNLVLCPAHMAAIAKEDKVLYKAIMAEPGSVFYSFKVWTYSQLPIYITSSGAKAAQGTAYSSGTHKLASITFLGDEVMKAIGTVELFSKLKDPDIKGDSFNFQMRALVSVLRDKYRGAILRH